MAPFGFEERQFWLHLCSTWPVIEMKAKAISRRLGTAVCALSLAVMLASCASTERSSVTTNQAFAPLSGTLAQYQQLAQNADADSSYPANLLLARALIVSGDLAGAQSLLNDLKQQAITPLELDEASMVQALLYAQQGQNVEAYHLLDKVNTMTLPPQAASYYYQLASNTEFKLYQSSKDNKYLRQAFEHKRILSTQLTGQDKVTVLTQCVEMLKQLPPAELAALLQNTQDEESRGFIEYAIIDSSQNANLKEQLTKAWQDKYSGHPLNALIGGSAEISAAAAAGSADLGAAQYAQLKEGDRVAVLLPLSGRFAASVGEPARLGVISALQDRNLKLNVVFYDTNRMTMEEIAARVKSDGTDFIIGPILKPAVQALLAQDLSLPMVLLNHPEQSLKANQWYFNLGPDYEGALAASKIALDGYARPLIISTGSSKAQRSIQGFNQNWQQVQGRSAQQCLLNVNALSDLSACPVSQADAVYLAAGPVESAKIKSALPASKPVYITDQSFNGVNSSPNEALLIGVNLGDMPWLITDSELKNSFMKSIPKADPQAQRIFAAAYDSINFALNVNVLSQNKSDVLHGLSGDIQLGKNGLIETAPMWLKIEFPRLQSATGGASTAL